MKIVSWEFESPPLHIFVLIFSGGNSSVGRALAWHARGHRFDSDILHF